MTTPDLGPSAARLAALLDGIADADLVRPTPCADTSVGDLLDHVDGLTLAFTNAARKEGRTGPASADASRLGDDWRQRIPARLDALVKAWHEPAAWDGTTDAGHEMIRRYIERFDSLFGTCEHHHGDDVYN